MKYLYLTSVFISNSFLLVAQGSMLPTNNEQLVKDVITELFDAYRAGDSLRVKSTFTHNATFQSAYYNKEGESVLSKSESINNFISYIGGGLDKEHDERLWNTSIQIDKNLATVWTNYALFHLVDTKQKEGCEIPDSVNNR